METYSKITIRDAIQLGSPATWAAAIIPVAVGVTCATLLSPSADIIMRGGWPLFVLRSVLMLLTAIMLQAAVNTFNDYADFKKGTDSADNSVDLVDVPIIHKNLNPKDALKVGVTYVVIAGVTGFSLAFISGPYLIFWGILGAAIVGLYSFGPTPISYLPISELVSGLVMGGIITVATWYALTGTFFTPLLIAAIPPVICIGLIMMTNNTCDIERDRSAGRRTLPLIIGMRASAVIMTIGYLISYSMMAGFLKLYFEKGLYALAVFFILNIPTLLKIVGFDFNYQTRPQAMKRASRQALYVNAAFILSLLIGALLG